MTAFSENRIATVAVIGGGASGLMAAVSAARTALQRSVKIRITVYEATQRVGKKLLVTGNGRCNLTNRNISPSDYHGSERLFSAVYNQFDNTALIEFFAQTGLLVRTDFAGRVYPLSNQASSVLDVLRTEAVKLGVVFSENTVISSIEPNNGGCILNGSIYADKCVIAGGGLAGVAGSVKPECYSLLKMLSIKTQPVFPALTALHVEKFTKALKGIRAEGEITVKYSGKELAKSRGEIQYTDYGLSGIPSMQVSRAVSKLIGEGVSGGITAEVDSAPSLSADELEQFLNGYIKTHPSSPGELLLAGIMPKRLGITLLGECSINPQKSVSVLNPAVIKKIVSVVKCKKYKISSVSPFPDAQVTAGGVSEDELNVNTLELNKAKNIYVCGELADVDGDCGGYNLQWAFSSGYVAGKNLVGEF